MNWICTATALLALGTFGGLTVTLEGGPYAVDPRFLTLARVLLVPLGLTMLGLAAGSACLVSLSTPIWVTLRAG